MPTDAEQRSAVNGRRVRYAQVLFALAFFGLLLVLPFGLSNFWLRVMTTGLMFAGLGLAMQIMIGLAGWPALGNVVFFGVGAYGAALLTLRLDAPFWVAIPFGGLLAAVVALIASRAMLSLRGSYFLMATVALNFAMLELVLVGRDLTNGPQGLTLKPIADGSPQEVYTYFYLLFLGVLVVSALVVLLMRNSRLGFGLLAIKGNEEAAQMLGVPTFRYRAVAWATSAALTGVIGGVYAFWIGYIDPESVFDLLISLAVILMVLLGGRLLIFGPILGALVYELLDVVAWREFNELRLAVLGLALILIVRFLPGGLPELYDHLVRLIQSRRSRPEAVRAD
jgi:branched-chain amino acid transport system permease protein